MPYVLPVRAGFIMVLAALISGCLATEDRAVVPEIQIEAARVAGYGDAPRYHQCRSAGVYRGPIRGIDALKGNPIKHPLELPINNSRELAAAIDVSDHWLCPPALHRDAANGAPSLRSKTWRAHAHGASNPPNH